MVQAVAKEDNMKTFRLGLCVLALVLLVGAPARQAAAQSAPAPASVRLAVQPLTNYTTVLLARDKGFFAEEKLNVTWTVVSQGAWTVEAVYGGNVEFGGSGLIEPLIARGNGLELMLAVANTRIRPTPPDNNAVGEHVIIIFAPFTGRRDADARLRISVTAPQHLTPSIRDPHNGNLHGMAAGHHALDFRSRESGAY